MFKFDNSLLGDFAKCIACAIAKHVHGRQSKARLEYGDYGNVVHKVLQSHFDGGKVEDSLAVFDREYDKVCPPGEAPSRTDFERANMQKITEQFLIRRPVHKFPFQVVETEKMVGVEMEPGYEFWMKRDMQVRENDTGFMTPVDHKTRWGVINEWWLKKFKMSSQFSGYIWGNRQLTGEHTDKCYVNALSMAKLPDSNRKCKLHQVKFSECGVQHVDFRLLIFQRTEEQIEKWKADAIALAKQAEVFFKGFADLALLKYAPRTGTFNEGCTFCEFQEWCRSGFDPALVDELTVYKPWKPWEGVEDGGKVREVGASDPGYHWLFDKERGMIFPSVGLVSGMTVLPNAMALKKLWDGGRDGWMEVWNGYGKMAQAEMAEFVRGMSG